MHAWMPHQWLRRWEKKKYKNLVFNRKHPTPKTKSLGASANTEYEYPGHKKKQF
jgi:hypothetical protein